MRLASKYPRISPLCLTVHMRRSLRCRIILNHLFFNFSAVPITCEFHYMSLGKDTGSHSLAYDLGAVVHVAEEDSEEDVDVLAVKLAAQLVATFLYSAEEDMDEDNVPPGQIFLCDVPRSVLSHKELSDSEDAVNTARLKLFNLCDFGRLRRNFTESQRWNYFTRRVKLVDPGFKPSQADIAASVKRRSVNAKPGGHANNQGVLSWRMRYLADMTLVVPLEYGWYTLTCMTMRDNCAVNHDIVLLPRV